MINIGFLLSLFAALFKSGKDITTKMAAVDTDSYITSLATRLVSVLLFGIGILLLDKFYVQISIEVYLALIFNSIVLGLITIYGTKAFEVSDVSIVSPLMSLIPISTVIPGIILLDEIPSNLALLGVSLVVAGTYILNIKDAKYGLFEPLKKLKSDRGARYAMIVVIGGGITSPIDKIGITETSPLFWVFMTHIGMSIVLIPFVLKKSNDIQSNAKRSWKILIAVGLFNGLIWIGQGYAYTYTQVSYVQAIKRISVLISILSGWIFFNEEFIVQRFSGGILIIFGVSLILFGM